MPPDLCIACVCLSFRPTYRPSACYSQALGKRPPHSTSAAVPSTLSVDTRPGAAEDLQPRPRAQLRHLPHGMAATKLKQEEHLMTANVTKLENRAVCQNTTALGTATQTSSSQQCKGKSLRHRPHCDWRWLGNRGPEEADPHCPQHQPPSPLPPWLTYTNAQSTQPNNTCVRPLKRRWRTSTSSGSDGRAMGITVSHIRMPLCRRMRGHRGVPYCTRSRPPPLRVGIPGGQRMQRPHVRCVRHSACGTTPEQSTSAGLTPACGPSHCPPRLPYSRRACCRRRERQAAPTDRDPGAGDGPATFFGFRCPLVFFGGLTTMTRPRKGRGAMSATSGGSGNSGNSRNSHLMYLSSHALI